MATLRRSFQDASRLGTGLISNGRTVAILGTCICGRSILTRTEYERGHCVECEIVILRADAEDAQYEADAKAEPVWSTVGGSL